jgi:hypothetical protein
VRKDIVLNARGVVGMVILSGLETVIEAAADNILSWWPTP